MKEYNEHTARASKGSGVYKPPMLSVSKKGSFRINRKGAELLGIKVGDRITVIHDDHNGEWYIRKSDDGLIVFSSKHCAFGFYSSILRRDFTESTGSESGGYIIASESTKVNGTKAHAILTSSAR